MGRDSLVKTCSEASSALKIAKQMQSDDHLEKACRDTIAKAMRAQIFGSWNLSTAWNLFSAR